MTMRSNYEFALESVLRYRRIQKDLGHASLLEAESLRDEIQQELQACRQRLAHLEEELAQARTGPQMDVKSIIIGRSFLRCLHHEEESLRERLATQEQVVDDVRRQLVEKARDEKVMLKVKEKDQLAYQTALQRRHARSMDELVLLSRLHLQESS